MIENEGFEIKEFPLSRLSTVDVCGIGRKKHYILAMIEADVTEARKLIRQEKRTADISFTAWVLKCIADLCAEHPEIHSVKYGRRKTVSFGDADISIVAEREVQGEKVPLPYVLRKANEKSMEEIKREIDALKKADIRDEGDYVIGGRRRSGTMKLYYALPGFLRRLFLAGIIHNPFRMKREMGTVVVTALGMMGVFKGWFVPIGIHPLEIGIGSIVKKPGVVDDAVEIREYLYLTVMADHDAVDGAPAARALSRLTRMLEGAYGLKGKTDPEHTTGDKDK
jgi:pyruvate/2-oxoglutarate dehydrogenase complex dihydrolipoamide acyltransferase (E2) component